MLAAISQVLNECTKPDQATPAALVLQGLHALCKAEVGISEWFRITAKLFYKDGSKNFSILRFFLGGGVGVVRTGLLCTLPPKDFDSSV